MSRLYRIDVILYATAYIKASSAKEARAIAREKLEGNAMTISEEDTGFISNEPYDSEDLPDVSLSPAVTIGETTGVASCVEE